MRGPLTGAPRLRFAISGMTMESDLYAYSDSAAKAASKQAAEGRVRRARVPNSRVLGTGRAEEEPCVTVLRGVCILAAAPSLAGEQRIGSGERGALEATTRKEA